MLSIPITTINDNDNCIEGNDNDNYVNTRNQNTAADNDQMQHDINHEQQTYLFHTPQREETMLLLRRVVVERGKWKRGISKS